MLGDRVGTRTQSKPSVLSSTQASMGQGKRDSGNSERKQTVTVAFIAQTRTLLRLKGNAINNCTRMTGTHQAVPGKMGHVITGTMSL